MLYSKACICEYAGTDFAGWQRQRSVRTIQKTLETALSNIYDDDIKIAGSGRTDAGVHSLGQVFSFSSKNHRSDKAVIVGLNSLLPKDISVFGARSVTKSFHSGKSSVSKSYVYKIMNSSFPPALYADRVLWIRKPIDMDYLNAVLANFTGEHDFEALCVKKTKKENTVRRINFVYATRFDELVEIHVNANGFLHNMVRIIVGTAIDFLKNGRSPDEIKYIIESKDRRLAGKTTEPQGLYQKEVFYTEGISGLEGIPVRYLAEK